MMDDTTDDLIRTLAEKELSKTFSDDEWTPQLRQLWKQALHAKLYDAGRPTNMSGFPKGVKRVACFREVDGMALAHMRDRTHFKAHVYDDLAKQLGLYLLHEGFTTVSQQSKNPPTAYSSDTEVLQLTADVYLGDDVNHFNEQLIAARIQGVEEAHSKLRSVWQYRDGFISPQEANLVLRQLITDLREQYSQEGS